MEFSFDVSRHLVFTSTPTKSTAIADHSICDLEASTIVSFTGPQFSPVPIMDSSSSELHTNDQSTTVVQESDSNMPVAPAPERNSIQSSEKEYGLKIVGDNIDKTVHTRFMRVDKQGSSLHYFHAYAAQDRFSLTMPEDIPSVPADPMVLKDLLPSISDKTILKDFFCDSCSMYTV